MGGLPQERRRFRHAWRALTPGPSPRGRGEERRCLGAGGGVGVLVSQAAFPPMITACSASVVGVSPYARLPSHHPTTPSPPRGEGWGEGARRCSQSSGMKEARLTAPSPLRGEGWGDGARRRSWSSGMKEARLTTPSPLRGEGWGEGARRRSWSSGMKEAHPITLSTFDERRPVTASPRPAR